MDMHQRDDLAFPQSLPEFQRLFPDDAACAAYLGRARWPDGFACPHCGAITRESGSTLYVGGVCVNRIGKVRSFLRYAEQEAVDVVFADDSADVGRALQ